ncbi:MAG: S8 family serine peptidase, partial [Oscillospiraceae bacterium]|nr:S8 family serine peptidase [Oscillospiraceae bacterium]
MLVKHKRQNQSKSGGIVMNKLNFKKRISLLLAFLMLFSLIVPAGLKAQESENKFVRGYDSWSRYDYEYICQDHIFDEVSQLVNDTWCYNFVGNINFRPGCNFMGVDGTQYELDSEAVPIMEYDKIIIPLNPILEITGEDISLNPLMQRMAIGDEVMMLPVSIIAEYFDFEYYWDEEGKEVILTRPFQTKRLMVRPLVEIDFEHLGPTHVIQSFDNVVYLQFATIEETRAAFDTLLLSNEIEGVGPDLVITRCEKGIQDIVFEPFSASSWDNVGKVGTARYAQYLRSIGRGNYRRVVAVLDTGVQANHPLLDGRVIDGRNVRENSYDTPDPNGHGTHVAGVIIANTPGLNVRIMPIVTACAQGNSTLITMRQGVHWAANRRIDPVDVINISWSVELPWAPSINWGLIAFEDAVNTAINNGITVVVSAGDDRVNVNTLTPARMDRVITVAASTRLSNTFRETNFGVGVCISAPGMDIFGPTINSGDRVRNGTSYATPHVSAAAAMTLIRHPGSSPSSVRTRLRVWTDTPNGWDRNMHGIGILDMTRGIPPSWQPPEGGTPTQPPTTPPALPTHTVTFFPNGGSGGSARYTQNFVHGQAQNLRRNTWTRPGYTFMGWASIPNGNVHYTEGQRVNILASHHLYAVWQIVHTVTFFPNGGSGGSAQYTQNFVHGQAQYLRRNTWQRPGYTFVGWASIPNGNVHYTEGQRVNILASHHLYAVWRPVGRATITSVTTTNNGRVTVNWTSSGNATNY